MNVFLAQAFLSRNHEAEAEVQAIESFPLFVSISARLPDGSQTFIEFSIYYHCVTSSLSTYYRSVITFISIYYQFILYSLTIYSQLIIER